MERPRGSHEKEGKYAVSPSCYRSSPSSLSACLPSTVCRSLPDNRTRTTRARRRVRSSRPPRGALRDARLCPERLYAQPERRVLIRFSLEPGAFLPADPDDPSVALLVVETSEIAIEVDAALNVTRGGAFGMVVATAKAGGVFSVATETETAGKAVTLREGATVFFSGNIDREVRNAGQWPGDDRGATRGGREGDADVIVQAGQPLAVKGSERDPRSRSLVSGFACPALWTRRRRA